MSDSVIKADFRPPEDKPDPDMVRVLEEVLERAKSGDLDAVMVSYSGKTGSGRRSVIRDHSEFMRALGEMHTLMTTMTMDVHLDQTNATED